MVKLPVTWGLSCSFPRIRPFPTTQHVSHDVTETETMNEKNNPVLSALGGLNQLNLAHFIKFPVKRSKEMVAGYI